MEIEQISKEMTNLSNLLKEAEKNEANLSGRLSESLKRLKSEFGLTSLEAAKKQVVALEGEIKSLSESINQKFQALKEQYEW